MNSKKKKTKLLKIILYLFFLITPTTQAITNILGLSSTRCNSGLVQSFEFTGSKSPGAETIEMCPTLRNTCCLKKDQLIIYRQWNDSKQSQNLEKRFTYFKSIYNKLLSTLEKTKSRAEKTYSLLEKKPVSNCKVLSKRLLNYHITDLEDELNSAIEEMYDFLFKSYEGFYCSICDANQHMFIDMKNRIFNLDEGFCRSLLGSSLNPLLYFHVHFVKYLNLVTKFVLSCDFKGDYTESSLPLNYLFKEDEDAGLLKECKKYRNEANWLKKCKEVCGKFHPSLINDFFKPKIIQYFYYEQYLMEKLDGIDIDEFNNRPPSKKSKKRKKKKKKTKKFRDFVPFMKYRDIFSVSPMANFKPDDFVVKIEKKGLDFHKAGILSEINSTIFNRVKIIYADRPDITEKNKKKPAKNKKNAVGDSSLENLKIFLSFLIFFFF